MCEADSLAVYLTRFEGLDPVRAIYCPFVQDAGAGMGLTTFSLFLFGSIGLALTIRTQHPGPIVVAGMLSAAVVAPTLPSQGARIMAIVLFFAISALGFYIYRRANSSGL